MLESVRDAFVAAGAAIAPLGSLDQVAQFFLALASVAPGVLDRARHVANRCGPWLATWLAMTNDLMERVVEMTQVQTILNTLPPSSGMIFTTERKTCVVCEQGKLEVCMSHGVNSVNGISTSLSTRNGVFTADVQKKKCGVCGANHGMSCAWGGQFLESGVQVPYPKATDARYFQVAKPSIWETSLLVDFEAQALFSHTGFLTFMDEYKYENGSLPCSMTRARQMFAHVYFAWMYLAWRAEMGLTTPPCKMGDGTRNKRPDGSIHQSTSAW